MIQWVNITLYKATFYRPSITIGYFVYLDFRRNIWIHLKRVFWFNVVILNWGVKDLTMVVLTLINLIVIKINYLLHLPLYKYW
jgi:hypothetical protein